MLERTQVDHQSDLVPLFLFKFWTDSPYSQWKSPQVNSSSPAGRPATRARGEVFDEFEAKGLMPFTVAVISWSHHNRPFGKGKVMEYGDGEQSFIMVSLCKF